MSLRFLKSKFFDDIVIAWRDVYIILMQVRYRDNTIRVKQYIYFAPIRYLALRKLYWP